MGYRVPSISGPSPVNLPQLPQLPNLFNVGSGMGGGGGSVLGGIADPSAINIGPTTGLGGLMPNLPGLPSLNQVTGGKGTSLGPWDVVGNYVDKQAGIGAAGNPPPKQDSTAEMQQFIKDNAAKYTSPLDSSGALPSKYTVSGTGVASAPTVVGGGVTAGTVATPAALKAGQLDTKALAADPTALNALKARAMSQGPSPWLTMSLQQQKIDEQNQADRAGANAMGSAGMARSALAMKGGLGGGAAERVDTQAARGLDANREAIMRGGATDRLGLGIADDQTKMALLSQIPGMDLATAGQNIGMNQFNINSAADIAKFNSGQALDTSKFNVGTALNAGEFNAGQSLEASKANAANALSSTEFNSNQNFDASKTNIANTLAGIQNENTFNTAAAGQKMAAFGAGKTSDAIANAGKK